MKGKQFTGDMVDEAEMLGHVMAQMSDVTHRRLGQELDLFALTLPQYAALVILHRHEDGCTMSELADGIFQLYATITGIVDRLEARGLVERRRDLADRRVWHVYLTGEGRSLLLDVEQHRQAGWLRIWSQFEPDDRQHMLRLMRHYLEVSQPGSRPGTMMDKR